LEIPTLAINKLLNITSRENVHENEKRRKRKIRGEAYGEEEDMLRNEMRERRKRERTKG